MRLFIGVELADQVRDALADAQARLAPAGGEVKWVERENLHFTVRFLGETGPDRVEGLLQALQEAVSTVAAFDLTVSGMGVFPDRGTPRIIWVGAGEGGERLRELQARVEAAVSAVGFPPVSSVPTTYRAHCTLGRVRLPHGVARLRAAVAAEQDRVFGRMRVTGIQLVESRLAAVGPRYSVVREFFLASWAS